MAYNLATTFELRMLLIESRPYFNIELEIKQDLLQFLQSKNSSQELEYEEDQWELLNEQKNRFEYLAAVVVVNPEKEGSNPFLLSPQDVSTPNHVVPMDNADFNLLRRLFKFCMTHLRTDCTCYSNIDR